MSREDWQGTFWVAVVVTCIAGVPLSGALGYWWRGDDTAGIFFGIGAWLVVFASVIAAISFRRGFGKRGTGE